MKVQKNFEDRRVRRTRQLFHQALMQLLAEKSFQSITVQDITGRADVNRGTFYIHFPDKYALFDDYLREEFQQALCNQLPPTATFSIENLRLLILTVMTYLSQMQDRCRPVDKALESLVQIAIQQQIYEILIDWLEPMQLRGTSSQMSPETIATVTSWAIFGAGTQWRQCQKEVTMEVMINQIMTILIDGLSPALHSPLPKEMI